MEAMLEYELMWKAVIAGIIAGVIISGIAVRILISLVMKLGKNPATKALAMGMTSYSLAERLDSSNNEKKSNVPRRPHIAGELYFKD